MRARDDDDDPTKKRRRSPNNAFYQTFCLRDNKKIFDTLNIKRKKNEFLFFFFCVFLAATATAFSCATIYQQHQHTSNAHYDVGREHYHVRF